MMMNQNFQMVGIPIWPAESDITNANTVDADSLTDTEPEAISDSIVEDVDRRR